MNALALTLTDSRTMVRRNLRRLRRYPSMTVMVVGMPVGLLLLFVYVLGGTMGAGIDPGGGRAEYLAYLVPGILIIAIASIAQSTAISVAMDMTEGIIARFRTMAIARSSILTGHVIGALVQTALAIVAVLVVAVLIGFRPAASAADAVVLVGMLALIAFAFTWLSVALGLVSDSVETASNLPMFLVLLPFLGSGLVPTESMPQGLRWFAEHQPFTPMIESVRGLLAGSPDHGAIVAAVLWSVAISIASFLWARRTFTTKPAGPTRS
jgi:ABC-2 type transport system permease protein